MKKLLLLVALSVINTIIYAQSNYQITGQILDDEHQSLVGASVVILPNKMGTTTDTNGRFSIKNIKKGQYIIEISFIGFVTYRDSLFLNKDKEYHIVLKTNSLNLNKVVVKGNYKEKREKEESLNIEIVNDEYLKQNLGGSVMQSLERLGGVSAINIGSGQSKPVIRGLGFNRVVVIENDIKHEAQQWGSDHGLEIDQYSIDNIEVIKGPASLMYGSDAIGGIINMKSRKVPLENTYGGSINLSGKSNNNLLGTSVSLYGRKNSYYAELRATILDYGDYKVPTDSIEIYSYKAALKNNYLRNTAGKEQDFHLKFGIIKRKFQSKFYLSSIHSKSGFFANAHGLEPQKIDSDFHDKSNRDIQYPRQSVWHLKINNTSIYRWNLLTMETNIGAQSNFRKEWSQYVSHGYMPAIFPNYLKFNPDLERGLHKQVYSGNVKLSYFLSEKWKINSGISSEIQNNQTDGRGFIIPEYHCSTVGSYLLSQYNINNKSKFQVGIRYDMGQIITKKYTDWFPSPIDSTNNMEYLVRSNEITRQFSHFSYSLGYNYNYEKWILKANIGKSFRMPIAKELSANGVNYHHFSYEIGNSELSPEISYQLDLGTEYNTHKFGIGISPFINYFSNYIYLNPSSKHDRLYGNGNQIFEYKEGEVLRYGGELHAHYQLTRLLQLGLVLEYVYSEQLSGNKKGFTLPFSPPASGIINAKYQKDKWGNLRNVYLSLDCRITSSQKNIVPPEKITKEFQVFNISTGGAFIIKQQKINVTFQIHNLFNTKYFNHISYYRLINVPEPGRNIILSISIPFLYKKK